jgi:uncharacterized protein DUF4386
MNDHPEISPQTYARAGGVAYLVIIVAGLIGEMFIRNKLIVSGDAAATASNIMASPQLWRIGIAGDLVMHLCDIIVILALYLLLRPVHKYLALLAMLFNLIQTAVLVANKLNLLMPLFLSGDANYLKAFSTQQLQVLAYISVKAHGYGFGIGLIFFGVVCIINGYLIFKSGYFPKLIGVMMQVAGVCYLLNSFALIVAPAFADRLFPLVLIPSFIGELSLCLWLIKKGVNVEKWDKKVNAGKVHLQYAK